jgi:anthranilate synthase/aminodeoxychorismate synthase-like glutamine amidotransferase
MIKSIYMADILIIDNYDSFTQTIAYYLREFDIDVSIIRNNVILDDIEKFDGCVISPGPGNISNTGFCKDYIFRFIKKDKPVLGICLGHQLIGTLFGGILKKADRPYHGETRNIFFDQNEKIYNGLKKPCKMTCYNSLILNNVNLDELIVSAWTENPYSIMGLRHKKYKLYGVQFHPESFLSRDGECLIRNFISLI